MDRPSSRGLLAGGVQKAPTGPAIERPERPSTASSRQQTSMQPPSTAQSSRPLGTASSRGGALGPPGTAFRRVLQAGSQAQQATQAQARPLTQQGMGGLKPSTAAGRQVLDRTYFINELRQKRQQIITVMGQMQEDLEVLEQKKAAAARADKMAGQLKKEVRLLQEALADNNIIIDKAGSQAPLQQIHAEFAEIKARNEAQQARVEDILSQRLSLEQQTKQVDTQISAIQTSQQDRLNSMAPSVRQAYSDLLNEQTGLLAEAGRCEEEAAELTAALTAAEGELSRNGFKRRVLEVQEQIRVLTQRRVELTAAEEAAKASPEEQREALMSRIKRDNAAVEQLTAEAKQLQSKVKQLEAMQGPTVSPTAAAAAASAGNIVDDPAKRGKYDELRAKERELTAFMDAFPQRRAAKQQELTAKQEAIVKLLQHLTEVQNGNGIAAAAAGAAAEGPPGAAASQSLMQSRMSLGSAAAAAIAGGGSSGNSTGSEVLAKRAELQKLEELEGKISAELAALKEQLLGLQGEVDTYGDVEGARRSKETNREELEQQQHTLQTQQDTLKAELADQVWQQQTKEALLKEQPAWPAIDRLDRQLKQVQQQCDKAREFIRSHEERSNYAPLVPQLAELMEIINAANIAAVTAA